MQSVSVDDPKAVLGHVDCTGVGVSRHWHRPADQPPQVAAKLRALAESLQVDELVVITWAHDAAAQRRSYEILAKEFC